MKLNIKQGKVENSSNFIDKMYKEKVIKRKIVNFKTNRIDMSPGFVSQLDCRLQIYVKWRYKMVFYLIEPFCSSKRP